MTDEDFFKECSYGDLILFIYLKNIYIFINFLAFLQVAQKFFLIPFFFNLFFFSIFFSTDADWLMPCLFFFFFF